MIKTFAVALLSASYVSAQAPVWPHCALVPGFVNGLDACGCADPQAVPVPTTSVCQCLDTSIQWVANGSNCTLGTAKKTAYINALRTRYEPFNNAASRASTDRANATAVTNAALADAKAEYETHVAEWEKQKAAFWSWFPYRGYWGENYWWYNKKWWPVSPQWKAWSKWADYRKKVLNIKHHNWARQDFVDAREKIEAKHEATPWTNQLDLIVGDLPNRPGAGYVPSSTWASATSSNQLGTHPMGHVEARDPQLAYEFNNIWGSQNNSVDDDQTIASASSANAFGIHPMTQVEALFSEGNNPEWGALEWSHNLP